MIPLFHIYNKHNLILRLGQIIVTQTDIRFLSRAKSANHTRVTIIKKTNYMK